VETLTIGFSRPKGWFEPFSWLIRLVMWTPYSHVYVRFHSDPYDSDLVFQASSLQVNFYGLSIFQSKEDVIREFTIPVSSETKLAMIKDAMAVVGTPYNLAGVFGMLLVLSAALFGKKIPNPISGAGDFCSQLIGKVMTEFLGDNLQIPLNAITPKDEYEYLENATA
jgi:hypothetical protein